MPAGSLEEEHALVLFDSWGTRVPVGTGEGMGAPVPPVSVDPEAVAVNDAVVK